MIWGEVQVDKKFDARFVVMTIVALAWLAYVGTELARDRPPEIWTWGILTGVYAALYQPWAGRGGAQGRQPGQNGLPGRPQPPALNKDAEDEA